MSRIVLVARCESCHGVRLPEKALRYDCDDCGGKNTRGHLDVRDAPPVEQKLAINASIMMDRFYENTRATDGTDIGSRVKHREYMKQNGLTTVDDFTETWKQGEKTREQIRSGEYGKKERREAIGRAAYEYEKRKRKHR